MKPKYIQFHLIPLPPCFRLSFYPGLLFLPKPCNHLPGNMERARKACEGTAYGWDNSDLNPSFEQMQCVLPNFIKSVVFMKHSNISIYDSPQ